MSPEASGSAARVARLAQEIRDDRDALTRLCQDLRELARRWENPSKAEVALGAVTVHAWYTGLERIFERVARQLDGEVPTGRQGHADLLRQVTVEVPGIRPAVVSSELHAELRQVLAFRHFFRHAYAVTLAPDLLKKEVDRVGSLADEVDASLDAFLRFLSATLNSLGNA